MANAGIKFDTDGLRNWYNWLDRLRWKWGTADTPGRNNDQVRTQFYKGLPRSFDYVVMHERMKTNPGTWVIAAYPQYLEDGTTAHPLYGVARPSWELNRADIEKIIEFYQDEWDRAIAIGRIKMVPKGSVYSSVLSDDSNDEPDVANVADDECPSVSDEDDADDDADIDTANALTKSQIKWYMVCLACGGLGHGTTVDGDQCLTKKLGININRTTLQSIRYPHGLTPPSSKSTGEKGKHKGKSFQKSPRHQRPSSSSTPRHGEASKVRDMRKGKKKVKSKHVNKQKHVRIADETDNTEDTNDETDADEESDHDEGEFNAESAHAYATVDIRAKAYQSYDDSSSSETDETTKPQPKSKSPKSATTKANKI